MLIFSGEHVLWKMIEHDVQTCPFLLRKSGVCTSAFQMIQGGGGRIYSHVLLRPPGYEMTWKALKSHEMTWIHSNEFAALLNFKSNLTIYIYIYINLYIYNISIIHITPFEFLLSGLFWSNFRMLKIAIQAWWFWCHIIHVTSCNKNQRPCESSSPFPKFLHRWGHFKSQEDYQNVTRWYLFARVFPRCYLQKHP